MERVLWQSVRRCPNCNSFEVHRSKRRSVFEWVVLPLLLLRPFRCQDCDRRHYGFAFSRSSSTNRSRTEARL